MVNKKFTPAIDEEIEGVGLVTFKKKIHYAEIKTPLENFKNIEQMIEYRIDPLTGHQSRVNALRAKRVKQAKKPSDDYYQNLDEIIKKSRENCFFCPENVYKSTPKFPEELGVGDRIEFGDSLLFPNLFAFAQYHAVGTIGKDHFTSLKNFDKKTWYDVLKCSQEYFRAVQKNDEKARFPSINFNYLPPSASSIIHPHVQVIQDSKPTKYTQEIIAKSNEYYLKTAEKSDSSRNYFLDLISSEKMLKERFISENDHFAWLTSFSPMGKNELLGISKINKTDITSFTKKELESFAREIVKGLQYLYHTREARSINFACCLGPISNDLSDHFRIHIRMVTRPLFIKNYTADVGFMELLHNEPIAEIKPETLAKLIRQHIN
ncbi:MAG: hypothetical protein U9O98_01115 [Asgard group archaeon]|nr:hypothetical protein [Asgard group archaeon]